ncbi:MAG: TlpA disulfide reductase family protein [Pirellulales bacterium]
MTTRTKSISAGLVFLLLASCGSSGTTYTSPNKATPQSTAPASVDTASTSEAGDVELSILSFDEIGELIAGKRGKVVVMDAWSTSCAPCLKDFHNLVELHKQYGPGQLACISLSFDYEGAKGTTPEDVREPVLKFLRSQGATFDNVVSNEDSDALYRKLKLNSVPAIFVYDRAGKLRKRFEDEGAYEQVRPLVAELVKESSPADHSSEQP